MKKLIQFLLLCTFSIAQAQFIQQPLPLNKAEFAVVKNKAYKKCFKYKIQNGDSILAYELKYNTMGLPETLLEKGTDNKGDSIDVETVEFVFNNFGKLTSENHIPKDDDERKLVYMYNANGKLITEYSLHADPATLTYKYDKLGKLKEVFVTLKMPELDSAGEWTKKAIDVPWNRYTFETDSKGRITKKTEYDLRAEDKKLAIGIYTWKYDAANRIVEYNYKSTLGDNFYKVQYQYNKDGLLIQSTETKLGEEKEEYSYIYMK